MLIAGNWKMYKTASETGDFCRALPDPLGGLEGVDVAVCPPFTGLAAAVEAVAGGARAAVEAGLSVIACVGELEEERERGETEDVPRRQAARLDAHDNL